MKSLQENDSNAGIRSLVVYKKDKQMIARIRKSGPSIHYPRVVMPEQPLRYIKAKKHECW